MKRFTPLLAALLIIACESVEVRKQRYLIKGNAALEERNYAEAIRQFEAAVKLDSCYVDALNNWGTALHRQKYYAEAVELYSRALGCKPDYLPALLNRANSWFELHRFDRALQDATMVLQKRDTMAAYFLIGLAQAKLGRYQQAVGAYKKVLQLDRENTDGLVNLAVAYYYLGEYDSASTILNKVILKQRDLPEAWNTFGMIASAQQKWTEALEYFNTALQFPDANPWYRNNRGYVYLMMNRWDEAFSDINQSIAADPLNAWAYRNKGIYYYLRGDMDSAIRLLEQALRMDETVEDIYAWLAEVYYTAGKKDTACGYYKKSVERGERKLITIKCRS
ncbi:MAG: tetratricopeptide repeat protein [Cyclobacteriaceae bacterium]|nr:tetratricopeptide repeat protein [Cyclobacteriaceae bacterium]MDW8331680.1 tetratricopeptide repeat protein [Cyclobacteriaceae bacterium]